MIDKFKRGSDKQNNIAYTACRFQQD